MPAKAPMYLKSAGGKNALGGSGGKKLRDLLSTDMISPPLGDFRHVAHVGRGGTDDMFGDTSFLQKTNSLHGNSSTRKSESNLPDGSSGSRRGELVGEKKRSKKGHNSSFPHEQSSTLDRYKRKKKGKTSVTNGENADLDMSPVLQSAFSLPILNNEDNNDTSASTPRRTDLHDDATPHPLPLENNQHNGSGKTEDEVFVNSTPKDDQCRQRTLTDGPPKPRRTMSAKGELKIKSEDGMEPNGHVVPGSQLSSHNQSSELATDVETTHEADPIEQDISSWSLDLNMGPSLMDEIMEMMDKSIVL